MVEPHGKNLLCIDLGTSGCKAAIFTLHGELIGFDFSPVPLDLVPGGGAEQDPEKWWQAIVKASRRLIEKHAPVSDTIAAVSVNTQWSGTVAVDQKGCHLMNAIIWLDTRGAKQIRALIKGIINVSGYGASKLYRWIKLTGGAPGAAGKDSLAHILYIKANLPHIYQSAHKFMEVKDYINLRLTGRFLATYDSITLHWVTDNRDPARIDYHSGLLKMTGLQREKLPDLVKATDVIGTLTRKAADDLGLPMSVKVVGGSPDTVAACIGSGAVKDYEGHTYIGTSSWISAHVPYKKVSLQSSIASLPSAIPNRYYIANEQESAGNCLNFLRDNVLYHQDELLREKNVPDIFKVFDHLAASSPPGANGLIFTPWLYGERTPVDNHLIRGGWHNLSLGNNRADIIRSCLEGVALNQKWCLNAVEKFMQRKVGPINMVGGGSNSDIWCQIHADVFNRPIRQMTDPIMANARGSAFIAAVALGAMTFDQIPARVKVKKTYYPDPSNHKIYKKKFKEFINIYHANKAIHARLNRKRS